MRRQHFLLFWLAILSELENSTTEARNKSRKKDRRRLKKSEGDLKTANDANYYLHPRRSTWQPRKGGRPCNSTHDDRPRLSVLVQSFADGANARQLAARLHALPGGVEVIVNDDSGRDHGEWLRWLRGANDAVLSLPNVHEIRAYNRMARMARGDFLLLLQGDHCLPVSSTWLTRGLKLFERFPRLGLLGGQMGFDQVPTRKIAEDISWGTSPCKPISMRIPGEGDDGVAGEPFMFVAGVNIGPMLFRREAYLKAGGFDEAFSCPGEPGIQLDTELSLQMWRLGYQVGLSYSAVSNGVGGRKTRTNRQQKKARLLNDALNGQRCERVMRVHDAAAVAKANEALERIPRPEAARERTLEKLGMRPAKGCEAVD